MPPYIRLIAASSAAAINEGKLRAVKPNSNSVESVNAKLSPNSFVSVTAEALDITLCPLVYSGNGGVCNKGIQSSSMYWLIKLSGRITRLLYFSSQQLMNPSTSEMATRAYASVD